MDTRLPYFDGQKDFLAFLRFLDDRKGYKRYSDLLEKKIAEFTKAAELYGKASEIEKKHEDAELWLKKARAAFGEREEKLLAGEKALVKELREERAKLKNREREIESILRDGKKALRVAQVVVDAREGKIGDQERLAANAEEAAQAAREAAVEAKHKADDLVRGMKEVMPA